MNIENFENQYKVSVVIPVYNGAGHVGRAIESVLKQKRPADEIIVVDDGSTDDTADEIGKFGEKVRYIHQENGGVSSARNAGINAATSEWIAFLDSDDEWLDSYLEKQIALLKRNPELVWTSANFTLCYCGQNLRKDNLDVEKGMRLLDGKDYFDDYFKAFVRDAAGWTGTMVVKKHALQEAGLFPISLCSSEDTDTWWRIAHRRPCIGYNAESLAVYHLHDSESLSKKNSAPSIRINLINRHIKLADKYNRTETFQACAQVYLCYWIRQLLRQNNLKDMSLLLDEFHSILPFRFKAEIRFCVTFPKLASIMSNIRKASRHICRCKDKR